MVKFLIEIEIRGPLERELRAADTVGGCLMVEQMVRDGFCFRRSDTFLTVRAMEHVTIPRALFTTGMASDSGA